MTPLTLPPDAAVDLTALAQQLGLADFDLLLIGDGSGTVYDQPAGWGCVAYDRHKDQVVLHAGATSCGTNNFAELFPYVQALWHHHQVHKNDLAGPIRVQIVSDSELTVRCGNGLYARNANACYWASIAWFETHGYSLTWSHVPRNSNPWHTLMDAVAGALRRQILATVADLRHALAGMSAASV
jgi:ribonuclease HI